MLQELLAACGYYQIDEWNDRVKEKIKSVQEKLQELMEVNEALKTKLEDTKAYNYELEQKVREQTEADELYQAVRTVKKIQGSLE